MVGLIEARRPGLDRSVITGTVERVAGGRAKRRRLAQALLDRPGVLDDGRSPAPRAVGDLLIALNTAGATHISAPGCAECGKPLRTLARRGEHWYCSVCGPRRESCAGCGQLRPVSCRGRDGRPRCLRCPPDNGRDPTIDIVDIVAGVDPSVPAEVIVAAIIRAAPRAGQRHRLAWALQDQPDLLTGAGAAAPAPTVLRLIEGLCDASAQTIVPPACPGCQRVIRLHRPIAGKWLCRNCTAKSRAQPCVRCGAVREAATRDEHDHPLCAACLIVDPANQEICIECRRRRPVSVRTPDGPCCPNCRPSATAECSICRRTVPCTVSMVTGRPWCSACQQRWARCGACGKCDPSVAAPLRTRAAPNAREMTPDSGAPAPGVANPDVCGHTGARAAPCSSGCADCSATRTATSGPS
jgi:hypothetical protein